jgi:hypothetical protein
LPALEVLFMRKLIASFAATAMLALGVASTASAQTTQVGDGLVVVQIGNVLNDNEVQVVVPVEVAAAIAANVCGLTIPVAVLGEIDLNTEDPISTTCNSDSRARNGGSFEITN